MRHLLKAFCQLSGAVVEVVQHIYQEAVEVHAAELLAHHAGRQEVRRQTRHGGGVPGVGEALLHADAALLQRIADLAGVAEVGFLQDLAWQLCQPFDVLGQSRRACHERRRHDFGVVLVLVHLAEKRAVAQLAVGERVDLGRRMRVGSKFAQHDAEHRRIRQVLEFKAAHIEVAVREDKPARVQVMADAGDRRAFCQAVGGLDGRGPNVCDRQLRQLRHVLGLIRGFLHLAKQRDLVLDALEVVVGEAGGKFGQASLPGVVLLLDGDHLHLGHMGAVQERFADEALEIPLVKRAPQEGEVVLVA